jgi:hypothetical protein
MKKLSALFALATLLSACSTPNVIGDTWHNYKFDLSGKSISISAPKGHFQDEYLTKVDLAKNENPYVTLLSASWIFSGHAGGMDLILALHRGAFGEAQDEFLRDLTAHLSIAYKALSPNGVTLHRVTRRQLGEQEWLCYAISNITSECALRIDAMHYISLKLNDINNGTLVIDARTALRKKIEESIEIKI